MNYSFFVEVWLTPSPLSKTMPVVRPEAYSDSTAWMATYMAGELKVSNIIWKSKETEIFTEVKSSSKQITTFRGCCNLVVWTGKHLVSVKCADYWPQFNGLGGQQEALTIRLNPSRSDIKNVPKYSALRDCLCIITTEWQKSWCLQSLYSPPDVLTLKRPPPPPPPKKCLIKKLTHNPLPFCFGPLPPLRQFTWNPEVKSVPGLSSVLGGRKNMDSRRKLNWT